jgi:hypothetical protein
VTVEAVQIPVFPTRKEVAACLGLTVEEVRRLDYNGHIRRCESFPHPVRYYGWSVRDFVLGK